MGGDVDIGSLEDWDLAGVMRHFRPRPIGRWVGAASYRAIAYKAPSRGMDAMQKYLAGTCVGFVLSFVLALVGR